MNTRIQELAREAGFSVCRDQWLFNEMLEKFSGLILTDVYDIIATYRTKVIFDDGFEYNCVHPIQAIQQHFGINNGH
jgi:hypothetical protein